VRGANVALYRPDGLACPLISFSIQKDLETDRLLASRSEVSTKHAQVLLSRSKEAKQNSQNM
jgi:hypothetical protein